MALIELKDVDFIYEESQEQALNNINLSINAGEFIALIGANGSGKSTLAKLLNGLLIPTSGKVYVDGLDTQDKNNILSVRQKVGMVFQNPDNQLIATMVEEDVAFGLANLGFPESRMREQVDKALATVGMQGFQRHTPHKLSGGQKQRIAIAGIIAMEPACIVLDEPTAMLDPQGRKDVIATVRHLNKEKQITVIFVTHLMEEASMADRIMIMDKGFLVREGSPEKIFREIDFLKGIDLDVPVVIELAESLRRNNFDIPDILTVDELVECLC